MSINYYNEIRLIGHDAENLTDEQKQEIIRNEGIGYDIETAAGENGYVRFTLLKDGHRFSSLSLIKTNIKNKILSCRRVSRSYKTPENYLADYKNLKYRKDNRAIKAMKSMFEIIPIIEAYNQAILKEINAI